MFILFLVVQISIFAYYWTSFSTVSWEIHIHYWVVSFWYLIVIIQPFLAVAGKISNHRTLGIIGFLIAGGVIFSGLSLLDIPLKLDAAYDPGRPGPPIAFYYGTLVVEFILMIAFAYAVVKSILHRKNIQDHSWWLVCSAFFMIAPALGRRMFLFWRFVLPPDAFKPIFVILSTELVYLPLFLVFALKFGKIKHQATLIGILLVFIRLLRFPIGSSETVQAFLKSVIIW